MVPTLGIQFLTPGCPPLSLSAPSPDCPPVESPMMKMSEWHLQKKAEDGAGFLEEQHLYQGKLECAACGIYIGKDHIEQELYLWPVWQEEVKLADAYKSFKHLTVFLICGGCAEHKGLDADTDLQVFDHTIWQTQTVIPLHRVEHPARQLEAQSRFVLWLSLILKRIYGTLPPWTWWLRWLSPVALAEAPVMVHTPQSAGARYAHPADLSSVFAYMSVGSLLQQHAS